MKSDLCVIKKRLFISSLKRKNETSTSICLASRYEACFVDSTQQAYESNIPMYMATGNRQNGQLNMNVMILIQLEINVALQCVSRQIHEYHDIHES